MAKTGPKPREVKRVALNLRLDPAVIRRIKLHSLLAGETASDVVARLAVGHLADVAVVEPDSKGVAS